MATAQEVIKNLVGSLDTTTYRSTAAIDQAVQSVSNFSSWSEVISTMVKDCRAYNGDYEKFLADMCDIVLDNEDTGAISGSDAGTTETKTAESVVPESGSWRYPEDTTFTIQGLKVTVPEQESLSSAAQYIVGALYTWWIDEALTLSKESFGLTFEEDGTSINEITLQFYDRADGKLAAVDYSSGQKCDDLTLKVNLHYYSMIDEDDPNGSIDMDGIVYLDRTIAHEMVHAVMAANIDYFSNLPLSFKEGIAELVHGIDDKRYTQIKNLASSASSLNAAFSGTGASAYAAGYMALRYLAKQAAEDRDPSYDIIVDDTDTTDTSTTVVDTDTTNTDTSTEPTVTYSATFSENDTVLIIDGDFPQNIWLGGTDLFTGEASEYGNANTITLDASNATTNLIFAGNSQDNFIQAGSGGSSLWGSAGNDTLSGGDGADMFWFAAGFGNDVAINFKDGTDDDSDIVNMFKGGLSSVSRDEEYVTLTMNDGSSLKIEADDVDNEIQYSTNAKDIHTAKIGIDNEENTFTYDSSVNYYLGGSGGENTLEITDETGDNEIWLTRGGFKRIQILDAQNSGYDNLLAGNTDENVIYGGSGTNSLWGGGGAVNDTLIGGSGQNNFWYGLNEGNDTISGANDGDVVNLYNISLSDLTSFGEEDGNIVIRTESGSLTLTDSNSPTMKLAEGGSWKYNKETQSWQSAE